METFAMVGAFVAGILFGLGIAFFVYSYCVDNDLV